MLSIRSLLRLLFSLAKPLSRSISTATETRPQKLEHVADELLNLTKLELHDYNILLRHKLGLNRYGPAVSGPTSTGTSTAGSGPAQAKAKATDVEQMMFDVKLEKFDVPVKIKIIKDIRSFADLGLKEAKDVVEKTFCVVKNGVSKEEVEGIVQKLKAAVVLG